MKISIDYDGTLWSHMNFFREFMISMQHQGHTVGMLTGHTDQNGNRERDIDLMRKRLFPRPDFWFGRTEEYWAFNGSVYKSMVILREGIDIHFDDCDYGNPDSLRLFREELGDQFYRLFIVKERQPPSTHYE